ncbi:hypothetical protein BJS_09022 [Bradyrhizobium japonicum SEMIA 5079]|nr:hypothetical protein BJS_09022 [Bradyrhizobium japonicum SEMIA 5079]
MIGAPLQDALATDALWQHFPSALSEPSPRVRKATAGNQGGLVIHGAASAIFAAESLRFLLGGFISGVLLMLWRERI